MDKDWERKACGNALQARGLIEEENLERSGIGNGTARLAARGNLEHTGKAARLEVWGVYSR
jgi:hypothetical protein